MDAAPLSQPETGWFLSAQCPSLLIGWLLSDTCQGQSHITNYSTQRAKHSLWAEMKGVRINEVNNKNSHVLFFSVGTVGPSKVGWALHCNGRWNTECIVVTSQPYRIQNSLFKGTFLILSQHLDHTHIHTYFTNWGLSLYTNQVRTSVSGHLKKQK